MNDGIRLLYTMTLNTGGALENYLQKQFIDNFRIWRTQRSPWDHLGLTDVLMRSYIYLQEEFDMFIATRSKNQSLVRLLRPSLLGPPRSLGG